MRSKLRTVTAAVLERLVADDGYVRINEPGAGEARTVQQLERFGVDVVGRFTGTPEVSVYAPEWALIVLRATTSTQGGMRRRVFKQAQRNPALPRALRAAHRLGGTNAVWELLTNRLYDLDSVAPTLPGAGADADASLKPDPRDWPPDMQAPPRGTAVWDAVNGLKQGGFKP